MNTTVDTLVAYRLWKNSTLRTTNLDAKFRTYVQVCEKEESINDKVEINTIVWILTWDLERNDQSS
jgi:hypothetical protein